MEELSAQYLHNTLTVVKPVEGRESYIIMMIVSVMLKTHWTPSPGQTQRTRDLRFSDGKSGGPSGPCSCPQLVCRRGRRRGRRGLGGAQNLLVSARPYSRYESLQTRY